MKKNKWYEEVMPDEYYRDKKKKRKRKKLLKSPFYISVITSFLCVIIFTFLIAPFLKSPTVIQYSDSHIEAQAEDKNENVISDIIAKYSKSSVYITSTGIMGGFFSQNLPLNEGTGVIVSNNGYIMTSASIINSGSDIKVWLEDGREVPAMVVGIDGEKDIAILKIDADGLVPVILGNSKNLEVGDFVITIGNPLAPQILNTVTKGAIAGINENIILKDERSVNLIQVDMNVNAGNIGGGIFNSNGEVVGIIAGHISSDTNLSFAVPIDDAKEVLSKFLNIDNPDEKEYNETPMIGILGTEESYGVVVETVSEGLPASKAGMKVGDVIIKADGVPVTTVDKINELRTKHQKGDTMLFTVFRDGETLELTVILE